MVDFVAELTANPDAISALTERVTRFLTEAGVDARTVHHVAVVLDELLTNAATHGGGIDTAASVRLTISPDRVSAEVVDGGTTFDPCVERNLDTSAEIEDRAVGGWGLLLVQRLTEGLAYERVGEQNRTTFSVIRAPECRNARADGIG